MDSNVPTVPWLWSFLYQFHICMSSLGIELLDLCQVEAFYSCTSCIQKAFVSCDVKKGYQSFVLIWSSPFFFSAQISYMLPHYIVDSVYKKPFHVVLYVILGRYFGMILPYFGMKIYYYLLF